MLKHMPEKALETFQNTLLYSKKAVALKDDNNRRKNNDNNLKKRIESNIADRRKQFADVIKTKKVYRIPLQFLADVGLVNFPENFNSRFILILEQYMNRLLESNTKVTPIPQLDAKIIIDEAPYISYPEIKLDKNFEVYFNSTLRTKKALRTGIRIMPYQQPFEINMGTKSKNIKFVGANRQFAFLGVSLVYYNCTLVWQLQF